MLDGLQVAIRAGVGLLVVVVVLVLHQERACVKADRLDPRTLSKHPESNKICT